MKIRSVGVKGRAGGQTDMTKLIVAFHNFANAPTQGDLIWTNHYAGSTLSALHETHTECYLLECRTGLFVIRVERQDGNVSLRREGMRYMKFRAVARVRGRTVCCYLPWSKFHLVQTLHKQCVLRDSANFSGLAMTLHRHKPTDAEIIPLPI
jgi:hypothetical protein